MDICTNFNSEVNYYHIFVSSFTANAKSHLNFREFPPKLFGTPNALNFEPMGSYVYVCLLQLFHIYYLVVMTYVWMESRYIYTIHNILGVVLGITASGNLEGQKPDGKFKFLLCFLWLLISVHFRTLKKHQKWSKFLHMIRPSVPKYLYTNDVPACIAELLI